MKFADDNDGHLCYDLIKSSTYILNGASYEKSKTKIEFELKSGKSKTGFLQWFQLCQNTRFELSNNLISMGILMNLFESSLLMTVMVSYAMI